jgi:enediyne biosynthesis protein E4
MPSISRHLRSLAVHSAFLGLLVFVGYQGRATGPGGTKAGSQGGVVPAARLRFTEVAHRLGIDFAHRPAQLDARLDHIARQVSGTGAAVSVCDPNGDGWPDLYATTSADGAHNALFVNAGDGTFTDAAASAGLADLNRGGEGACQGSVWADADGDGDQDAFVYKWGRSELFANRGELAFEDVTDAAGLELWANAGASTWIDYDRDGALDLVLCGYFAEEHDLWNLKTTRIMQDSFEFASNGGRKRMFRNRGDGTFEETTGALGLEGMRFTYATVAADLDRDGWTDLYVANDYAAEQVLLNQGGARFEEAEAGLERESKSGMCVALGNLMNDGRLAVFVTNISKRGFLFQGNNLRLNNLPEGGGMTQVADGAVVDCGWAWGAQFGDLDRDGWQDLVVVNGFVSASRTRDYWYQMSKLGGGAGDVVADAANWPDMEDRSLSGYERTHVLLHPPRPSLDFVEVGAAVGIEDEYDGRAVALADLDRDGDLDVVIANQSGPLLVYQNDGPAPGHWLSLELTGVQSNREALGAEVTLEFAGGTQVQVVTSASGFAAQNDRRLFFGLGQDAGPVRVHVRWPSGGAQTFGALSVDRNHQLVEGQS